MNTVDGSEHYEHESDETLPSLLTIILDTNPHAWAALSDTLPLSKAVANILVFINAHLAFHHTNKVAVIASHSQKAQFLYPSPSAPTGTTNGAPPTDRTPNGEDVEMADGTPAPNGTATNPSDAANKYRPFRLVEDEVMRSLRSLLDSTSAADIAHANTTMTAGALSLALAYINKQTVLYADSHGGTGRASTDDQPAVAVPRAQQGGDAAARGVQSRILVVSVSSDLAFQYIPVMNCIFAAQRKRIPIDVLKLYSTTAFLQQAADATRGIYLHAASPLGLLQYLMMAFLPDQAARRHLVQPTQVNVDFRAACFCHKRVVDVGFVCSICLSIFCEPPPGAICLTCGTHLQLGDYGAKPAVVPRKKKKRKRIGGAAGGGTPTPTPKGGTPVPE
ncbi:MAG: General transcription factor IIH subunit 3 [Piccolia ochrophora]|nr:MAG: General transcription factor IIH subunit 3 [Piccolia ochrophora]